MRKIDISVKRLKPAMRLSIKRLAQQLQCMQPNRFYLFTLKHTQTMDPDLT